MKRIMLSLAAAAVLLAAATVISNSPLKGDDNNQSSGQREDERELEVQIRSLRRLESQAMGRLTAPTTWLAE